MNSPRQLDSLSREEFFDLVWSKPATTLAAEFGVSDVAIHKRCKKLHVPTPPRGYWAKLEFGKAPKKPELPPSPEEIIEQAASRPVPEILTLPSDEVELHPIAAQFLAALTSAKSTSYDKLRVHLSERDLPKAEISKLQAPRAAKVLHSLLTALAPRGLLFRKARSSYDSGHFEERYKRLYLKIEEELIDKPEVPGRRARYSAWSQPAKVPCGQLTFTLSSDSYPRDSDMRWVESEKLSLEKIVAQMVKRISGHYAELRKQREAEAIEREKQRIESEIRWKKHQEAEAIRLQEEAKRKHAEALEEAARTRQEDFLKAAEWWRIHRGAEDFIAECERRWCAAQVDGLTEPQKAWLVWAREVAKGTSPFENGYPEPARDGAFDAALVSFGGPYPAQRKFPQPPTMPVIPAPVVVQQGYGQVQHAESKPYPFWLKYQRH